MVNKANSKSEKKVFEVNDIKNDQDSHTDCGMTHTQFIAAIVQSSEDAIIGMDLEGIIKSWNTGAQKIFGYTPDEAIGKPVSIIYPPGHYEELDIIVEKIKKGESINHYETERKDKHDKILDISLSFSPIKDNNGEIVGFSKVVRDFTGQRSASQYARSLIEASLDPLVTISPEGKITDVMYNATVYKDEKGNVLGVFAAARDYSRLREATRQLESSNRELEAFSYSVCHDLRAPLRGIEGFSELLLREYSDKLDEKGLKYLQYIQDDSKRMAELIDNMIELSKLSRGELDLKPVNISALASNIADELKETEPDRKVEFIIEEGLITQADESLLRAAMENLLGNAWKFTSKRKFARIEF